MRYLITLATLFVVALPAQAQNYCKVVDPDLTDYIGECKNGLAHGKGVAKGKGDTYEGQFFEGIVQGRGTMRWKSGNVLTGEFKGGKAHGTGTKKWTNGVVYSGKWENDKQIYGKVTFPDGDVYEGGFQANGFTPTGKTQRELAEENHKRAKYERLRRCPHIYNGRSVEFDARRALYTDYYAGNGVVTGFSPERGVASIRKPNGESVEIGCERIAE